MKILDLSLTYHWFDEILSGQKKEEYREMKPFYQKRLLKHLYQCCHPDPVLIGHWEPYIKYVFKHYDAVRFHHGQGSRVTMLVECKSISIGYGNPDWGAPTNEQVFIISLGQILSKPDNL